MNKFQNKTEVESVSNFKLIFQGPESGSHPNYG